MPKKKIELIDTLFIHVPKVAGSSIEKALYGTYGKVGHLTLQQIHDETPELMQDKFIFAFVRNPYDRLLSAYYYMKTGGRNKFDEKWAFENLNTSASFEEFVCNLAENSFAERIMKRVHFQPQHRFLTIDGALCLDFTGRYEQLHKDFDLLAKVVGFEGELSLVNQTKSRGGLVEYTSKMSSIVADLYKKDFEMFRYERL